MPWNGTNRMAGAVILKIAYGYTPANATAAGEPDPLVGIAETALDIFSKACAPGVWAVDVFPECELIFFILVMCFVT